MVFDNKNRVEEDIDGISDSRTDVSLQGIEDPRMDVDPAETTSEASDI